MTIFAGTEQRLWAHWLRSVRGAAGGGSHIWHRRNTTALQASRPAIVRRLEIRPALAHLAPMPRSSSGGGAIPRDTAVRVVGDVHGEARAFAHAAATEHFVVQLGDLTDRGPDSAAALRLMFDLIDAGRGLFLLGNHDYRLARALAGRTVRMTGELADSMAQLDPGLAERAVAEIARAPAWLRRGGAFFVHGGFHTGMLEQPAPRPNPVTAGRADGLLARALYGEPTGRTQADGFPERSIRWVDRIPAGLTVYCGHDCRSADGRPYVRHGAAGGTAVFLDTGAGKGGHLSWVDLPPLP